MDVFRMDVQALAQIWGRAARAKGEFGNNAFNGCYGSPLLTWRGIPKSALP
jgi:hypothetical protein